jgi:hypothetical protein
MKRYLNMVDESILERRRRVDEQIDKINKLPGWRLDKAYIRSLSIRKAEEAVACVFFLDEDCVANTSEQFSSGKKQHVKTCSEEQKHTAVRS